MTDRKRALQEAWRALAGWHVGMVIAPGDHDDWEWPRHAWTPGAGSKHFLPDLDAPANWGRWVSAAQEAAGFLPLWLPYEWTPRLPGRLLRWLVGEVCGPGDHFPPEVLTWRALEQELAMPVEPGYGVIMTAEQGEVSDE